MMAARFLRKTASGILITDIVFFGIPLFAMVRAKSIDPTITTLFISLLALATVLFLVSRNAEKREADLAANSVTKERT